MKPLGKRATLILNTLVDRLNDGHLKLDNTPGFMPVVVEHTYTLRCGNVYSVSHYYEQNGDLMADPDVTLLKCADGYYYPLTYQQDNLGIYQIVARIEVDPKTGLEIASSNKARQKELASFCNTWLNNIKHQQRL